MSENQGYTRLQISLHWIVAALIIAAFVTHDGMGQALDRRIQDGLTGLDGAQLHTIFGGAAFFFILVRIVVRLKTGAPAAHGSPMVELAAKWGHRLLYALMIITPALGAASWYGHMPDLGDIHEITGKALMIVALGHAAVAVGHHLILKDETLLRMLRPGPPL